MYTFNAMLNGVNEEMAIDIPAGVAIHTCKLGQYPDGVNSFKAIGGTYAISGTKPAIGNGVYTLWYVRRFSDERTKLVNGEMVTYDMWFVDARDIPNPPRKINTI